MRVLVVLDLLPRVDVLARLAVAVAEVAVVEDERGEARLGEDARVVGLHELFDVAPAARHHDDGCGPGAIGQIEVAASVSPRW